MPIVLFPHLVCVQLITQEEDRRSYESFLNGVSFSIAIGLLFSFISSFSIDFNCKWHQVLIHLLNQICASLFARLNCTVQIACDSMKVSPRTNETVLEQIRCLWNMISFWYIRSFAVAATKFPRRHANLSVIMKFYSPRTTNAVVLKAQISTRHTVTFLI